MWVREKVNELVSKAILVKAEGEDKWRTHCLTSSQGSREGDKKRERKAVADRSVSAINGEKEAGGSNQTGEKTE